MFIEFNGKAINMEFVCVVFIPPPSVTPKFSIHLGLSNSMVETLDFATIEDRNIAYKQILEQVKAYKLFNSEVKQ